MSQTKTFVCIGAGNVATHLVKAFCSKGYKLIQVYSRTMDPAISLANAYNAQYTISLSEISEKAGFYLVSVTDQALREVLDHVKIHDKLIFHTAGSHGLEVFGNEFRHFGVLYPLQTFTKDSMLDISKVPFLIEAGNEQSLEELRNIAGQLSEKVYVTDSETRRWIHLAAVFACNFTNHMQVLSREILKQHNLDNSLLTSLIEETCRKSLAMDPVEAQTGPAFRNDSNIIGKHIKMLENQPLLQKIYTFTSESIRTTKSSKHNKAGL